MRGREEWGGPAPSGRRRGRLVCVLKGGHEVIRAETDGGAPAGSLCEPGFSPGPASFSSGFRAARGRQGSPPLVCDVDPVLQAVAQPAATLPSVPCTAHCRVLTAGLGAGVTRALVVQSGRDPPASLFSYGGSRSGPRLKLTEPPSAWAPEWRRGAESPTAPDMYSPFGPEAPWPVGLGRKEAHVVSEASHTS